MKLFLLIFSLLFTSAEARSHWGSCAEAARQGGPCGCMVANMLGLPRNYHGRNLWWVPDWYFFPKTPPRVGSVAIWGRRHVELVTAVHGDGTVSTKGSVGFSHVPARRLTFVEAK